MAEMKGIKLCGECGNYDWKKHKCKIGCNDDSNAQSSFYGDCPLPDVVPKSEVDKIFEEIQKIFVHRILHNESQYFEGVLDNITKDLDELKKKYTESES